MLKPIAAIWTAMLLNTLLPLPRAAAAYDSADINDTGYHNSASIGPRAAFYHPTDADHGQWSPGAQLRLPLNAAYALETSADFTHYPAMATTAHTTIIQATVIGYFFPSTSISPYFLLGAGWYLTHADAAYINPRRRFGQHIGAGLEWVLGGTWSIDGSYRFLWDGVTHDLTDRGFLLTTGLNYRF